MDFWIIFRYPIAKSGRMGYNGTKSRSQRSYSMQTFTQLFHSFPESSIKENSRRRHKHLLSEQKKLDEIGMVWEYTDILSWEQCYSALQRYYKAYGNIRMTGKTVYENLEYIVKLRTKDKAYISAKIQKNNIIIRMCNNHKFLIFI